MPQNKFTLTRKHQDALANFLEYSDVHRLSRNLRNMLLLFLEYEPDGIPSSMPDLPYDLQLLFQLLDEVE